MYDNLVFEGAGCKGVSYCGALEVLAERDLIKDVKRVGGSSAGGIVSTLLAIGMSVDEIRHAIWNVDFNDLADDSSFYKNLYRFIKQYGWYKGDFYQSWVNSLLKVHTGDPKITFKELKELEIGPELFLVGSNVSTRNYEVFCAKNTPDMSVSTAMRITMSIPFFYRSVTYKKCCYVDGGLFCNSPVSIFDNTDYTLEKATPDYNSQTLCFRIDNRHFIDTIHGKQPEYYPVNNIKDYLWGLLDSLLNIQSSQYLNNVDLARTIHIDSKGIATTQFDLTDDDKLMLIQSGRDSTEEFFKNCIRDSEEKYFCYLCGKNTIIEKDGDWVCTNDKCLSTKTPLKI